MDPLFHLIILVASVYGLVLFAQRRLSDKIILALCVAGVWMILGLPMAAIACVVVYLAQRGWKL